MSNPLDDPEAVALLTKLRELDPDLYNEALKLQSEATALFSTLNRVEVETGALKNRTKGGIENVDKGREPPKMNIDPTKNRNLLAAVLGMAAAKARKKNER